MSLPHFSSLPPSQFDSDIAYLEKRLDANPEDHYATVWLLRVLDYYTPSKSGLGVFSDCQREIVARYQENFWVNDLLDIDKAAQHYHYWNSLLDSKDLHPPVLVTQLFAGQILKIHGEQTNCVLRMSLFGKDGVISRFCDDCFKVQILAEDLTSLIQTYFVLRGLELPRDNTRKCMVELRDDVPYPYKGYIFCESEEEVIYCLEAFSNALQSFGISNVHCGISHGCSEYGLKYPEYKYSSDGAHNSFVRSDSWDRLEADFFKENKLQEHYKDHHNKQGITINDVLGFRAWIKYAEIIGDDSCKKFLGGPTVTLPEHFTVQAEKLADKRKSQMKELRERLSAKA